MPHVVWAIHGKMCMANSSAHHMNILVVMCVNIRMEIMHTYVIMFPMRLVLVISHKLGYTRCEHTTYTKRTRSVLVMDDV